nr:PREDICTED: oxysterol-binding protein-related protein 9 [Bemisia tabaci]
MATMEGSLSKWTNVMKGWQFRWFVLDDNAGLLSYYTSREKMMRGVRRGCVRLKGAVIGIDLEDDSTFTITVDSKTFHFQARDAEEREKWIRCLEDTILRHAYGYKSSRLEFNNAKSLPTIHDFDKKLAEADAYLQILIDQTKNLEARMNQVTDPSDKSRCQAIWNHVNVMLEQVKHTIILLQIAKNTAHPVNGVYQPVMNTTSISGGLDKIDNNISTLNNSQSSHIHSSNLDSADECTEAERSYCRAHSISYPVHRYPYDDSIGGGIPPSLVVPETSYSSSEDDDFFDARDEVSSPSDDKLSTNSKISSNIPGSDSEEAQNEPDTVQSQTPSDSINSSSPSDKRPVKQASTSSGPRSAPKTPDGDIDYDALYEDENENEVSLENHGSVVTHLISQVKIGMDLTKVVLPTFILERRSLLEMYADFFVHPDLILKTVELTSPKDRMVEIVKWYLTSYHASRKSGVAKKPYNPILGEVFKCHWNIPGFSSTTEKVPDGPLPDATKDQLIFIAEQVSHHPPISAFYGEHFEKRVQFCAHVWTKSKFLGLSIGVHNVGEGRLKLLDHNEEYICTFPNGYGRSILTTPWIELGGSVSIDCPQSGYKCAVEFHTKPFYGGKKHRVTADVFAPNDKKPFLSINGVWNGLMEAKWNDTGKVEPFVDTRNLEIIKKVVVPIKNQEENESRRVWKEVTLGLKYDNVEAASAAKYEIEQRQRDEALTRKRQEESWQSKWFKGEAGGQWEFINPLEKRIKKGS